MEEICQIQPRFVPLPLTILDGVLVQLLAVIPAELFVVPALQMVSLEAGNAEADGRLAVDVPAVLRFPLLLTRQRIPRPTAHLDVDDARLQHSVRHVPQLDKVDCLVADRQRLRSAIFRREVLQRKKRRVGGRQQLLIEFDFSCRAHRGTAGFQHAAVIIAL